MLERRRARALGPPPQHLHFRKHAHSLRRIHSRPDKTTLRGNGMTPCKQCGGPIDRSGAKFCSIKCRADAKRGVRKFELTPQFIEDRCIPEPNSGCWIWERGLSSDGYGAMKLLDQRAMTAHRASYIAYYGSIADDLEVDHLCRVRCCVNPEHLEAVTHLENSRRRSAVRTHCPHGHPLDGVNKRGRYCKTCSRQAQARQRSSRTERTFA
jgi:hypothetical protein